MTDMQSTMGHLGSRTIPIKYLHALIVAAMMLCALTALPSAAKAAGDAATPP